MDRVTEQEQAKKSHVDRKQDVDVDAEHDEEVSRRASHVGLRREQKRVAEADSTNKEVTSNTKSVEAVNASLEHFAKQLHVWEAELYKLIDADITGPAGSTPVVERIKAIYDAAKSEIARVGALIPTVNAGRLRELTKNAELVEGAARSFHVAITKATQWATSHGETQKFEPNSLMTNVEEYGRPLNVGVGNLKSNGAVPATSETQLATTMMDKELAAAAAALDSLKDGNENEVARVVLHVRYITGAATNHPLDKAQKEKVKRVLKVLDEIREAKPKLQDRLNESHIELDRVLK